MTAINAVSTAVYTKGAPLREKLQTYILALIFLFLLYDSPSGLVVYWILNNLFSLCKNIVLKMKNPGKVVYIFFGALLLLLCIYAQFFTNAGLSKKGIIFLFTAFYCGFYFVIPKARKILVVLVEKVNFEADWKIFAGSCVSLAVLSGFLLPVNVINTSVSEFSFIGNVSSPVFFIKSSLFFFIGLFVFWPAVIFKMFGNPVKKILQLGISVLNVAAIFNVFIFKYSYGTINNFFKIENGSALDSMSAFFVIFPVVSAGIIFALFLTIFHFKKNQIAFFTVLIVLGAEIGISTMKFSSIRKEFSEVAAKYEKNNSIAAINSTLSSAQTLEKEFHLKRKGKNVIIIFLDRAISAYFPYIIEQLPSLNKSMSGFKYYPNCISFGGNTINGAMPMMGGYDYIPGELEKSEKTLLEKQNEAILKMPQLFNKAGYNVQVSDVPYANMEWNMDMSFYKNFDYIDAKNLETKYGDYYAKNHTEDLSSGEKDKITNKNLKNFSILQILYPPLRSIYYNDGQYYSSLTHFDDDAFLNSYSELYYLPEITDFDTEKPGYIFIDNLTCHSGLDLAKPDYRPVMFDETKEKAGCGPYPYLNKNQDYLGYQCNAAAFIQLGKFFDYLKENETYDSSRIIIVGDHGFRHENIKFKDFKNFDDVKIFNAMLLVKDFGSSGKIETDDTFMTNAETPKIALEGVAENTFKTVSDFEKFEVIKIDEHSANPQSWKEEKSFRRKDSVSYTVHTDIFDEKNWEKCQ